MAKISFLYQNKNYVNRPAYDLLDNIKSNERVDKVSSFSFILEKEFGWFNGFAISFYNYKNNVCAMCLLL
jgi:hypothetical protein